MATIGTFTSTGNGFTGTVRTLALNAKAKLVGLAEDRPGHRARLPLGQAGRSELPRSDLRHPDRGGRPGRSPAHLVPPKPGLTARRSGSAKRRGRLAAVLTPVTAAVTPLAHVIQMHYISRE